MESYATIAAKWWADTLRNIDARITKNYDMELKKHIASMCKPPEKNIRIFEDLLAKIIEKEVSEHKTLYTSTSHNPESFLNKIALQSGINISCLPYEASMRVRKTRVVVSSLDYDSENVVLLQKIK